MEIKELVKSIWVDYTRGTLENICESIMGEEYAKRTARCKLEQIAFIIMAQNLYKEGRYRISTESVQKLKQ